ncbi:MAG: efflux RND transporter periplasmic adaptor subunit [Planctomycetota bacterium]
MLPLCVIGAFVVSGCGTEDPPPPPPPPTVEVATPESRTVTEYFNYTGTFESMATAEIRARVEGFLEEMHFEESTEVEAGAVLFTIEKTTYEVAVGQAQAALARAEASESLAEAELARTQQAFDAGAANEIELLERRAELEQAQADVLNAQESIRAAELDLSYTEVRSPISGRIDQNYVDVGNLVGRDGPTLLARVDVLDPLHLSFDVSESIVLRYLDVGQDTPEEAGFPPVEVALANDEGFPHRGRVDFADNRVDASTGTLTVRAVLPNTDGRLYPGLFARIRVPWETRENAVVIFEEAVSTGLEGKFVLVIDEQNIVSRRPIELGERQDDGMIVALSGLEGSERYIVRGLQRARPGAPVSPRAFGAEGDGTAGAQP